MRTVRAWRGRDCIARARVCYLLPRPLEVSDGDLLPDAKVTITEFSAWSPGARDHMRWMLGLVVEASGVLGEEELVVAYGKVTGERPASLIAAIEAHIARRFGPIVLCASRAEAMQEAMRGSIEDHGTR